MPQITISEAAFAFLQSHAVPLEDTASSVMDRLIAEYEKLKGQAAATDKKGLHFDLNSVPSVKFTTIKHAKIAGKPARKRAWNNILEDVIAACADIGHSRNDIRHAMAANCKPGKVDEGGFRYVEAANLSFQGLEANRAYKNIVALAERFQISIEIGVVWQDNEDAALPNKTALIVYP